MRVQYRVTKAPDFNRVLRKFSDSQVDRIVHATALEVEAEAKRRAPVDTGRLRSSIRTRRVRAMAYRVATNVEYAPYVEFGTRRTRPQPFLGPAVRTVIPKVTRKLKESFP